MRIADALAGVQRLYVDTAPFIYYVEDHPHYGEIMEMVFETIATLNIQIVTSVIALTEILAKPLHAGDEAIVRSYMQLFKDTQSMVLAPVTREIAERAALWRLQANLRTPDALILLLRLRPDLMRF